MTGRRALLDLGLTEGDINGAVDGIDAILSYLGVPVRIWKGSKAETVYTPEDILDLEAGLSRSLIKMAAKVNDPLQEDILGLLTAKDWTALADGERETIYDLTAEKLKLAGGVMGELGAAAIQKEAELVYAQVRKVFSKKIGISSDFEAIDKKLIATFARDNNYWIGKHYTEEHLAAVKRLGAKALEEGWGRDELAGQFKAALGDQFKDYKYWDVLSSSVINRSRSYSTIRSMHLAGVEVYVWWTAGDERVCPICKALHGQEFSVEKMHDRIVAAAELEEPEDLKVLMPWVGVATEDKKVVGFYIKDAEGERVPVDLKNPAQLQELGLGISPIHGKCRCDQVPKG